MHLTRPGDRLHTTLAVTTTNVNEAPTVTGGATTGTIPEIDSTPPENYTYDPYASP